MRKEIHSEKLIDVNRICEGKITGRGMDRLIETRTSGSFCGYGFFLDPVYDWVLGKDEEKQWVLLPIKK